MVIEPPSLLPSMDIQVFVWREDAEEWMVAHDLNPLELPDDSESRCGHHIIEKRSPTCLIWFDVDATDFGITELAGTVASECWRLLRHAYEPFISATTPCDDVVSELLSKTTSYALRECALQLRDALDVRKADAHHGIARGSAWFAVTDPETRHVPDSYELVRAYRDWQRGMAPAAIARRYGISEVCLDEKLERVRTTAILMDV